MSDHVPYSARPNAQTQETPTPRPQAIVWPEDVSFAHPKIAVQRGRRGTVAQTRITACFRIEEGEDGAVDLAIGYSFCSPKDLFVKAEGRKRAFERLTSDPFYVPLRNAPSRQRAAVIAIELVGAACYLDMDIPGLPSTWNLASQM